MESYLEREFSVQMAVSIPNLPEYEREYRFHPTRRWRFDFAFPEQRLAIEIDGGSWVNGRHNLGVGFACDCEKYNSAVLLGWRVLRFTGAMVRDGSAIQMTEEALKASQ